MGLENQHINGGASLFVPATAHTLRGEGFDASEDGTGRGTPLCVMPFDTTQITSKTSRSQPGWGRECHTLSKGQHAPAVAFRSDAGRVGEAKTPSADAEGRIRLRDPGFNIYEETAPTLDGGSAHGVGHGTSVRRLTPRECERLQGFPEIQKCYTVLVCRDLSDHQKANALAALPCRKLQSNAWSADAGGWTLSAEAAAHHSSTSLQCQGSPVAVDVLIDLERQEVRLHSAGKSFSLAGDVGAKNVFPLPTGIDNFAHLAALLTRAWALAITVGKVASPANTTPSTTLQSGSAIAISSGREIEERASDAATAIEIANRLSMSTTLPSGLDTATLASTLKTLCCCVVRAIAGFIPEITSSQPSFVIRLITSQGYTDVPYRGKPAADGPRYKALGNSMAVPVMAWIGERIDRVEQMEAA